MDDTKTGTESRGAQKKSRAAKAGGVKIDKLIEKYGAEKQSKGLADLLNLGSDSGSNTEEAPGMIRESIASTSSDSMVLNEILRTVREKENAMEARFDGLEKKIGSSRKSPIKNKRLIAASLLGMLAFGALLGSLLSPAAIEEKAEVQKPVKKIVEPAQKKLMVTNKFVNMRSENSTKAAILTMISPAQTVEILGRKGGWIHINYHNKLSGKVYKGYVWEEFLTTIK